MKRKATILIAQAALVPCQGLNCNWCNLMQLAKNIINFMLYDLAFPISAIMIVVGGIMIMTAGSSTERVSKGRTILTAAIVGLLILLLSWLILDTIFKVLAPGFNGKFGPWNEFKCS